jgi:hypothetical protein
MRLVGTILFYVGVAVCLWPLYVCATVVVNYAQKAPSLLRIPPAHVAVSGLQGALLMWAIGAAVVLFRRNEAAFGWLVILLALAPIIARMTERAI